MVLLFKRNLSKKKRVLTKTQNSLAKHFNLMKYWLAFLGVFTKTHHCRACIHNVGINSICLLIWLVLINNRLFFSKLAWPAPA